MKFVDKLKTYLFEDDEEDIDDEVSETKELVERKIEENVIKTTTVKVDVPKLQKVEVINKQVVVEEKPKVINIDEIIEPKPIVKKDLMDFKKDRYVFSKPISPFYGVIGEKESSDNNKKNVVNKKSKTSNFSTIISPIYGRGEDVEDAKVLVEKKDNNEKLIVQNEIISSEGDDFFDALTLDDILITNNDFEDNDEVKEYGAKEVVNDQEFSLFDED